MSCGLGRLCCLFLSVKSWIGSFLSSWYQGKEGLPSVDSYAALFPAFFTVDSRSRGLLVGWGLVGGGGGGSSICALV